MKKGTILITGAAGFTGRHFVNHALASGYQCVGLVQNIPGEPLPCPSAKVNLLDINSLDDAIDRLDFDHVVHFAAISYVAHGSSDDIYRTNIVGTTNLLDALKRKHGKYKKIVVASSGNVYGNSFELPISEATALNPVNDYAVSKVSMEMAVRLRMPDLPIILTRPFNYTGVGQPAHFLVPKIVKAFRSCKPEIELGNTDVARDFTDVRDLVNAYLKLLESDVDGEVVNVCSGKATSLNEIIKTMENLANYEIIVRVKESLIRENEIKTLYGTDQRLVSIIGAYRNYSLADTLHWMYHQ